MAGLLLQWSEAQMACLGALTQPVEVARRTGSLLRRPASEAGVAGAERRLGVQFPPSYREFLLLSDGAFGDTMGAVAAGDSGDGDGRGEWGFLPVAEVMPYVEADPFAVEIWSGLDVPDRLGESESAAYEGNQVRGHGPIRHALLISRRCDANCSLLVPVDEPRAGQEWEVWHHFKEGTTRWSSFRAYLYDIVEDHLGVDVDEADAVLLLATAEAGDPLAAQRLGRVRSPVAAPLLIDAARRCVARYGVLSSVMGALGRIGGPEVVQFLTGLHVDPSWQSLIHTTLARIGTPEALDHLAEAGAAYELANVGDPRAAEIAARRLSDPDYSGTAVRLLQQLPDPKFVPALLDAYHRYQDDGRRVSILFALAACGAPEEARRWASDLVGGSYGYAAQALLNRLDGPTNPPEPPTT